MAPTVFGQFVAKVQMDEEIEGICDNDNVYSIFPGMDNQVKAESPLSEKKLTKRVNEGCQFLKDNPNHKDEGMLNLYINCEGKVVKCELDGCCETKDKELDAQIVAIFNSLGIWTPSKINGKPVDSMVLISFTIKKGQFELK